MVLQEDLNVGPLMAIVLILEPVMTWKFHALINYGPWKYIRRLLEIIQLLVDSELLSIETHQ